eukprot:TRINITY_DN1055_c0_g1_i6.p1 TRINITY_DN1055_c0_g1~~TRINITY_DN1055_c0_g1_i6.p1  ORF type:complete len:163 (+),score=51.72 TRINITY_DN1055_c0_g1_i6:81-569(+)
MCIRDRYQRRVRENDCSGMGCGASTAPREEPPAPPAAIPLAVVAATAVISPEDHQDEEEHAEEPPPEEVDLFAAVVAGRLHEVHSVCSTLPERVHQRDYFNHSPLHLAAHYGDLEIAELLLASGADVTVRCKDGSTPLDMARKAQHTDVVQALQRGGAQGAA